MKIALVVLILLQWSTAALTELSVNISVSYTPPPGVELGPNEYRAASGPVVVNCTATGGTGNISYQWSSTCRSCPFERKTSQIIRRSAVHSDDNGTHTCTAIVAENAVSVSIHFTVVGAGIHVFHGIPRGSFSNNSLVSLNAKDMKFHLEILCRSDSMMANVGQLIGLDGSPIVTSNSNFSEISNPRPGELRIVSSAMSSTDLAASAQGVYTCRIPLLTGVLREISIGIYPSEFTTIPSITNPLVFSSGSSSSILTCTSTGSVATTVTFMRNGTTVGPLRGGESKEFDGVTYQLTQTVTNRAQSTYQNVLTINQPLANIVGSTFRCSVGNILGMANASQPFAITATVPSPSVTITPAENDLVYAGSNLTLICTIRLNGVLVDSLTDATVEITWTGPYGNLLISNGTEVEDGTYQSMLVFTPLHTSDTGSYSCNARVSHISEVPVSSDPGTSEVMIIVAAPDVTVNGTVNRDSEELFSFTCVVNGADNLEAMFNFTLIAQDSGTVIYHQEDARDTQFSHSFIAKASDAGRYTCQVTVTSTFLDEPIVSNTTVTFMIQIPTPTVTITSAGNVRTYYAGSNLTLVCTIRLNGVLMDSLTDVTVESRWTGPHRNLDGKQNGRINTTAVTKDADGNYSSKIMITPLHVSDAGNYSCNAGVNHISEFILPSDQETSYVIINVKVPTPQLTLRRDPDTSVTLRHGDTLHLSCTIELDPAVDIDVRIAGTWDGQGVQNHDYDTVRRTPSKIYEITRTIASLEAARSSVYTCTATVSPREGVADVTPSQKACSMLDITIELLVTIPVSYNPPPGVELGPNEYRAASGPVTVTCTAEGATGTVRYQWSSTCRNCAFKNSNSSEVFRAAVHSGDTGSHTCRATDGRSISGSDTIDFHVVGAGIHVFQGTPSGSLPNNGLVAFLDSPDPVRGVYLRFVCRSDSTTDSVGNLIGLRGMIVSDLFNISRPQPGELAVENIEHSLMPNQEGVYTCRISLAGNTETKEINIGIYAHTFNTKPQITNLVLTPGSSSSNLNCVSTGSPPTTVTWRLRNGDNLIMRDGDIMSSIVTGLTYQMTQIITDRRSTTYENILTLMEPFTSVDDFQGHRCIITNTLGNSIPVPLEVKATILPTEFAMLGENYQLTCRVSGVSGVRITYQWSHHGVNRATSPQLNFRSIRFSDNGTYHCTATVMSSIVNTTGEIFILIPKPTVHIQGVDNGNAGSMLTLTCKITIDPKLESMMVMVNSTWSKDSEEITSDERVNVSTVQVSESGIYSSTIEYTSLKATDTGSYRCTATVSSTSSYIIPATRSALKDLRVLDPRLMVSLSSSTTMELPNVPPHNTFSLTCTATVPQDVTLPKSFSWKRRSGESLEEVRNDSSTVNRIANSNLDQPVSTSILTVTETAAGTYHFQCQVELEEIRLNTVSNEHSITIITFSLSTRINFEETNLFAGEKYTLTCIVTVTKGVPDNLTAHWSGPGVGEDGVMASTISAETEANGTTESFNLTFNPLRQSHNGNYECFANLTTVSMTNSSQRTILAAVPKVMVVTSNSSSDAVLGESYTLHCAVLGADRLNGTINLRWSKPLTLEIESGTGKHLPLLLMNLELSDAGQYICNTTVTSPYIIDSINNESIEKLHVAIPRASVMITHDGGRKIYAGSVLTLTCTITLDERVAQNKALMVNNTWTGPTNETITNAERITITYPSSAHAQYLSTLKFQTVHESDTGHYSCCATVSHKSPQYIKDGTSAGFITFNIQAPNVALSLTPNTTRLPNVPPYNTFSLTCTATAPEGVVSPKTFSWWRQNVVMNSNLTEVLSNSKFNITNSTSHQPVSTSMLTVTETTAEEWYYHCIVTLEELTNVINKSGPHLIHVTGPTSPEPPVDLLTDNVTTHSATVSWTVPTIAFTPETYVVHYGTNMDILDSMSDPIPELSSFTAINNKITITLTDLIPNTMYFYYINSTNSVGSNLSHVANFTTEIEASGIPAAAVGGGIAAALLIPALCIFIAGGVWWVKINGISMVHSKLQIRSPNPLDKMINVELIAVDKVGDHVVETTTFQDTVRKSIPVAEFVSHVSHLHMDENGFESEYRTISKEPLASHDTSQIPCNKERNRFVNIYPYDFSRVKLKEIEGEEGSDYINASFIDGYAKENEYVAAQGPLPETVGDFWRMVWEYKLSTIVMLTRCKEGMKYKCQQYWPDELNQTLEPGNNLVVTLTSLLPFVEYEIRNLTVADASNPSEPALQVTHLHYVVWPDHGVPTDSASLINFIRRVRKVHPHCTEVPLLVHCSAGVGRTGTFITIDTEMQRIEAEDVVDIHGCIKKLRARRVFMVQTVTQYVFIHDALKELILCGETDIPAADLLIAINRLSKTVPGRLITGFEEQFEVLGQFRVDADQCYYSEAQNTSNFPKNRYTTILAGSCNRVHLKYTGAPGSDYINANFIDGYKQRGAYIATQGPLASTVKDFWRMIWQYQSKCIVMLCREQEEGEEFCYPYWPEKQGTTDTHDKIKVTLLSEEDYGNCIVRMLAVTMENKGTKDPAVTEITQFHFMRWPMHGEPSPTSSLLEVIDNVTRVQMATGNRAITVMCNDGVGRTGAFICLHAQLERLKAEGVVDIFQFIKSARRSRPGLVQNVGQYILCHKALADFMDSFETYANFKELV